MKYRAAAEASDDVGKPTRSFCPAPWSGTRSRSGTKFSSIAISAGERGSGQIRYPLPALDVQAVGFKNLVPSGGQCIFVDQPAKPVAAENRDLTWRAKWNDFW
jgi:hypothetical protein